MKLAGSRVGLELVTDIEFFFSEMTFHDLGIGLALPLGIFGTSPLTRELHSHTEYPRPHMFDGSELNLEFGFGTHSMQGKYLEDEIYSIPRL